MKILQVINSLNTGGAEKLLLEAIPKYIEHGVVMDLVILNSTNHPFLQKLKEQGVCKIYELGLESPYNPIHIFRLQKHLNSYDIVHVHLFPSLYWVALAKFMSFSKTPIVFTEHNTTNKRRNSIFFKFFDKLIYRTYTKIITISDDVHNQLKNDLNVSNEKVQLIFNGVNLHTIKNAIPYRKEDLGIKGHEKIILQVSSFTKQKDQKTLIRALTHLDIPCRLLLVGDGDLMSDCKILVENQGLNSKVSFLGIRMDVPRLLKTADIVVLSSNFEGLSLASIEGLASGSPMIASDAPGLSHIVGGAGILFPIRDEAKLAFEIRKLLNNEDFYNKIANECIKRAQLYSLDKMIDEHIKLYKEVCQNPN